MFKKYIARQFLSLIAEQFRNAETTPSPDDDEIWRHAYLAVRALALYIGWIDDGGTDDPGPNPQGGDGGGP